MMSRDRSIKDITFANIEHGDVTLIELDEIYRKLGFYFEVGEGKFRRIKKERKN
ncbi:hypothetical protein [Peptacetobacter hominis]|uniref:hypothetical protein n=1 Tax=Peptacetobacter hominis TaxID=2743610 RepID=UPI0015824E3F|nr:hypothetical protein [Peptacetobacter hominis]